MHAASPQPGLLASVGNTPLVELTRINPKPGVRIFAKLEGANPSGSVKDRIAVAMVRDAEKSGRLKPGGTLVEASTGNTAIALATVARQLGYQLEVVVPDGVVPSIADTLALYGVQIRWVKPLAGMRGAIEAAMARAEEIGGVATRQFDNPANLAVHYDTTGAEISAQLAALGLQADAFVAGIGTGGTLMGAGCRLLDDNPDLKLIGVEPRMGERLQGLRSLEEGFHPPLLDLDALGGRYLAGADVSLRMAHRMVREEGVLAGVSGGATLYAALRLAERMRSGVIVIMVSDGAWKYLPARPWDDAERGNPCLDETHWW